MNLTKSHRHSSRHKAEVQSSRICGCFYCFATFPPGDIKEWVGDVRTNSSGHLAGGARKTTALCPKCGVDAVIGSKSGYPVDDRDFLKRMYKKWFKS